MTKFTLPLIVASFLVIVCSAPAKENSTEKVKYTEIEAVLLKCFQACAVVNAGCTFRCIIDGAAKVCYKSCVVDNTMCLRKCSE